MFFYKNPLLLLIALLIFFGSSCNNSSSSSIENELDEYIGINGFEVGTYCAEVTYSNPNTGTENTYTLEVEVSNNEVIQINWSNGGWLDEDHFSATELDSDGQCSFTSDKGYDYTVQIIGQNCGFTDESTLEDDIQNDETALTCPQCGGEKEDYENTCSFCQSNEEEY